jgi:predicted phage terminase large subunit-like protein
MDKGSKVLWEEFQPLWKLMTWKWQNGSKAFNTEYMNTPLDEESQIFVPDNFKYFDESDLIDQFGNPKRLEYFGFWDIALGKSSRSDYNAIVTIGRHAPTGILYIVDAWGKKCTSHEALKKAAEKIEEFGHKKFAVETIGVGHDMHRQLQELLAKKQIYTTRLKPISHHEPKKEKRIESLEPLVESGFLRFKRNQRLLLEQLEQFPTASHDDLPDATAGAVDLCGGLRRKKRTYYRKPSGL